MNIVGIIISLMLLAISTLRAQLVADGATNTLSNVTTNISGNVTVGTNGSFTLLVLSDNALLTNSANGNIGLNSSARSNEVRLQSPTAQWRTGGPLFVGNSGSSNRLLVSNGALLENNGSVIAFNPSSSNNTALVTGNASFWSNRSDLTVGYYGPGNQLVINGGAVIASRNGFIGRQTGSSNNLVVVSGSGSTWSNQLDLTVGNDISNHLVIEGGASVSCSNGVVAGYTGISGPNGYSDDVLLTGPGSLWNVRAGLSIGGGLNRLVISNGAALVSGTAGMGISSNHVIITGANSVWSNQFDFTVFSGGDRLEVTGGGSLIASNTTLGSTFGSNTFSVRDAGSLWNSRGDFKLGDVGNGNVFIASNGATVLSSNAMIGASTNLGNNNFALLTGAGTLWSNRNNFTVGNFSSGNRLVITNGAMMSAGNNCLVGANASASSNWVIVDGGTLRATNASGTAVLNVRHGTGELNSGTLEADLFVLTNQVSDLLDVFGNGTTNSIRTNVADTYPSSIAVAGLPGLITKVTVTLSNLNHAAPTCLDILLVSPSGQKVILMSDAGASSPVNVTLTFDDAAVTAIPQGSAPSNGSYRPADYPPSAALPSPAPSGPYSTSLSSFNGTSPNGAWNLYLAQDCTSHFGGLAGWGMQITSRITNGGTFEFNGGTLITRGISFASTDPLPVFSVTGSGPTPATWDVRAGPSNYFLPAAIFVGSNSSLNQVLITNGAVLQVARGTVLGENRGADFNSVLISGSGSVLSNAGAITIGDGGSYNQLVVTNGGLVFSSQGNFSSFGGSNNTALVTGVGSVWRAGSLDLRAGSGLMVGDGGMVFAPNGVDAHGSATNNRIVVDGGALLATNAAGTAMLEIRGTNVLNSGLIEVDLLSITNAGSLAGIFEFNGGTLKPGTTDYNNGRVFTIGNGASSATLQLRGGKHTFANGLVIANNGTLDGNGTVVATIAVSSGGTLSPGDGIGTLILSNTPSLGGTVLMECLKTGATRFNDQLQVANVLLYGGSLVVTNLGVTPFALGDNFKLFNANTYGGSFSVLNLPPLDPGLAWTNKLLLDGSIEVVPGNVSQPKISNIQVSGTNVILSGTNGAAGGSYAVLTASNIAVPSSNWLSIATGQFGSGGQFSFTNGVPPGDPQRYFRIRTP